MIIHIVYYLQVVDIMMQQRVEKRGRESIGKATEAAREAYEGLPI